MTKLLTPRWNAHCGVKFFELCDQISRRNRNRIRIYFSLFIRGPDGFKSWRKKTGGWKYCETLPLTIVSEDIFYLCLCFFWKQWWGFVCLCSLIYSRDIVSFKFMFVCLCFLFILMTSFILYSCLSVFVSYLFLWYCSFYIHVCSSLFLIYSHDIVQEPTYLGHLSSRT